MTSAMGDALRRLAEDINGVVKICPRSWRGYKFDIGKAFRHYGWNDVPVYTDLAAVAPVELKPYTDGTPSRPCIVVLTDRDFKDYVQLDSGLAIPRWVAAESDIACSEWDRKTFGTLSGLLDIEDFKRDVEDYSHG